MHSCSTAFPVPPANGPPAQGQILQGSGLQTPFQQNNISREHCPKAVPTSETLVQSWDNALPYHVKPMLFQCWPIVCDAGPALKKHWVNVSCLMESTKLSMDLVCGDYRSKAVALHALVRFWVNVTDAGPAITHTSAFPSKHETLNQCLSNVGQRLRH